MLIIIDSGEEVKRVWKVNNDENSNNGDDIWHISTRNLRRNLQWIPKKSQSL